MVTQIRYAGGRINRPVSPLGPVELSQEALEGSTCAALIKGTCESGEGRERKPGLRRGNKRER